jgi:nucleoside-diphosphate-sugar epimerase
MTILVTGGNGFIGSQIVRLLHDRGHEPVHATHRSANVSRLGAVADKVTLHRLDLADTDAVVETIDALRPRVLYHFGAVLAGPGEADPPALLRTNVVGVMALFEAARQAGTEQIIFASSLGTYGRDLGPGPITDTSLQRPNLVYGVSKLFGESLGGWYRVMHGIDVRSLRYPAVIGPGVTTWSLAQYASWMIERAAHGDPFSVWVPPETAVPVMYFKDAARAALELAAAPADTITTFDYLVDGPRPTPTAGQIAAAVCAAIPSTRISFDPDPKIAPYLTQVRLIDDRAARTEWGWAPEFDVGAMVTDLVDVARHARG